MQSGLKGVSGSEGSRNSFAVGLVAADASVSWLNPEAGGSFVGPDSKGTLEQLCRKALAGSPASATAPDGTRLMAWPLDDGSRRAVVAAHGQATAASGMQDDFCSLISHELKTPVAALRMHIDYLIRALSKDGLSEFRRTKLLEMARTGLGMIDMLTDLIENLVGHMEFFEGEVRLARSNFDLSELLIDISARLRSQLLVHECSLDIEIRSRTPGYWDKGKLDQLIVCLLNNAMKYGEGKPIRVEIDQDAAMTRLSVIDQGIGVHPDDHERIFNRFERASNSGGFGGLGLGLFIARKIVEAHGGTIGIQSAINQGCRMDVLLPMENAPQT